MKRLILNAVILTLVLFVTVLSPEESLSGSEEVYHIKLGTHWPATHLMTPVINDWINEMETRAAGKLKITYFGSGQLVSLRDAYEKISTGICEAGNMAPTSYPSQFPLIAANDLPFAYESAEQGTKALWVLITSRYFDREFESNNLKLLWGLIAPPYVPITKEKQIRTLEDWKGLRFRSWGGPQKMTFQALGAIPVGVASGDVFTSLSRGSIDGLALPLSAASAFKLQEVAKYVTNVGLSTVGIVLCMNLDTWKNLPEDIQGAILAANKVASERAGRIYDEKELAAFSTWKKAGIIVYTPPIDEIARWREATAGVWDQWIKDKEAKGLPAKKLTSEMKKLVK